VELTNEDVADILALMDSLPYDELDLRTPRFRLTLRRAPGGGWTEDSRSLSEPSPITPPLNNAHVSDISEMSGTEVGAGGMGGAGAGGESGAEAGLVAVRAPLPGTFYRAPRPGAAAFVEVGDRVDADTVVAIVETMKLMNSVHAGTGGRVARICLENAEFAPDGTTLMLIDPVLDEPGPA
jgi:acetyl-CoA carboxylase biotin carboxyl carrier protein